MKKTTIIICMLFTTGFVQAQEFKTGEKMSDQLKNGAVPGWQYAPARAKRIVAVNRTNEKHNETFITQVRKGTAPGMRFKAGGTAARSASPAAPTPAGNGPLASETGELKQAPKPVVQTVIPSQEAAPVKQ